MKIRRLDKLPKRKVTVDDLLNVSDIAEVAAELNNNKYKLDDFFLFVVKVMTLPGGGMHG